MAGTRILNHVLFPLYETTCQKWRNSSDKGNGKSKASSRLLPSAVRAEVDISGCFFPYTPKFPDIMVLTLKHFSESLGGPVKMQVAESLGLGQYMIICFSKVLRWCPCCWSGDHTLKTVDVSCLSTFLMWRQFLDSFSFSIQPEMTIFSS